MFAILAFWIVSVEARQKIQRDRPRKFRGHAESAFFRIKTAVELHVRLLENIFVDLAGGLRRLRFAERVDDFASAFGDFFTILFPGGRDSLQNFLEAGLAITILRRKIGPTDERLKIGREPNAHRPATTSGRSLDKSHIDAIDVRPFLAID